MISVYDVVIIGSGPAGLALASSLDKNITTCIVERGPLVKAELEDVSRIEMAGPHFHPPGDKYRVFGLGGASSKWAGRCVVYDEQDLQGEDGRSQWPINYDELVRYYPRAFQFLEVPCNNFEEFFQEIDRETSNLPLLKSKKFDQNSFDIYSRPTNVATAYLSDVRDKNIHIRTNTHFVDLIKRGPVLDVLLSSKGKSYNIRARHIIFACGGLESTRILLNLRDKRRVDIKSACLGQGYMTHVAGTVGNFTASRKVDYGYAKVNGIFVRRKYRYVKQLASDSAFTARIHFPDIEDASHNSSALSLLYLLRSVVGYEYGLRLTKSNSSFSRHLLNVVRGLPEIFAVYSEIFFSILFSKRKIPPLRRSVSNKFNLDIHCEDHWSPESLISLSDNRDQFDLRTLIVKWNPPETELLRLSGNIRELLGLIASDVGEGKTMSSSEIQSELLRHGAFGGHHIGTTRFGTAAENSILDENLCLHGTKNVYSVSAAALPTSGHANPTLTVVALALRLGDHINRVCAAPDTSD